MRVRTKNNFSVENESSCLMKGEKEPVMDDGMMVWQRRKGKEALRKSLFSLKSISLLHLM